MNYICIDFGTCNTVISYFHDNKILQLCDDTFGDCFIPSTIYFIPENIIDVTKIDELEYEKHYLIGHSANNINNTNNNNTSNYFYQFKRFLGITSKSIDTDFINKFDLEYTTDDDIIYFYLNINDIKLKISIIDLVKLFFKGLNTFIKNKLNITEKIEIILTCPAYFHDLQRSQLKSAVENANFNIFKIYNEPTTAAIYYIHDTHIKNNISDNKIIIYDIGGGTIDTTVVEYHEETNTCEVIDIDGNNTLGGIDIDNILIYDIYNKYKIDKSNKKWLIKIKKYAEEIKIKLSYNNNCDIYIENVPIMKNNNIEYVDNLKISYSIHNYNNIINEIIDKMIEPIKNMHYKYKTKNVIFIGGPTQIPLLQNKINSFLQLNIKTINCNNNNIFLYKTIVSQGGCLIHKIIKKEEDFCLLDIIPMNIGISDTENNMIIMLEKNSKIPNSIEKIFTTTHDFQRTIDIEIFEGVSNECNKNTFIGSYKILGIPPLPKGKILIKILFKISYNGILNISINGFKNPSDDSTNFYDFKLLESIKLIPMVIAKDLIKKIINKK